MNLLYASLHEFNMFGNAFLVSKTTSTSLDKRIHKKFTVSGLLMYSILITDRLTTFCYNFSSVDF